MNRVYLMADFGKGPVLVYQYKTLSETVIQSLDGVREWVKHYYRESETFRRWWLVEAESADAARRVIGSDKWPPEDCGRILDQGGAA